MTHPVEEFALSMVAPLRRWADHGFRVGLLDAHWGAGPIRSYPVEGGALPSNRVMTAFGDDMRLGLVPEAAEIERRLRFLSSACEILQGEERQSIERRFREQRRGRLARLAVVVSLAIGLLGVARLGHEAAGLSMLALSILLSIIGHRAAMLADARLAAAAFRPDEGVRMPWSMTKADMEGAEARGFATEVAQG